MGSRTLQISAELASGTVLTALYDAPEFPTVPVCTLDDRMHAKALRISSEVHTSRGRVCVNSHKWLCAPKGAGFLYAHPDRQHLLQPLVVSWGWEARDPGPSPFQDYFEWIGTDDPSAYLSVPAAITFQKGHDWTEVRAACHALAAEAQQRSGELTGLAPICPSTTEWWVQMVAIPLPQAGLPAEELKRRLWGDYQVEAPMVEWQGQRFVRVSIQAYNTRRDVNRLVSALAELL